MHACSHWYFFIKDPQRFLNELYPKVNDSVLARLAIGVVPDLDVIFNKWPSLKPIYKGRDEALHEDEQRIIEVVKSRPELYDLRGISIHNKQDGAVHGLINQNMGMMQDEFYGILKRNLSPEKIERIIENYIERRIIEKHPKIRKEMLRALRHTKDYSGNLAEILCEVYKEHEINPRSVRRAIFVGNLFESMRLMSDKYTHYIPKRSEKRKKRFSYSDIIMCHIIESFGYIENFDSHILTNGFAQSVLSEGVDEEMPPLGKYSKDIVDKFLTSV